MKRREFFSASLPKTEGVSELKQVKKVERRTSSGISEYTGTWSQWEVKHLLSRALFGYNHADLSKYGAKTMSETVAELVNIDETVPDLPINDYSFNTTDPECAENVVWLNTKNSRNFGRRMSLRNWWMKHMISDGTIREKMTLFWHNHFAAESAAIADARMAYVYLALLRKHCMGNLRDLTKDMTIDPGMLKYLNGYVNSKEAPDENYARELQELFTLGKGPDSKYTEDDVKAAARVLTGWRIDYSKNPPTRLFQSNRHDEDDKQFSAFYGNKVIKGQTGATAGEAELDEMLDMIFAKSEVSKHIIRRLYVFFVYYEIDADTEANVIEPLAQLYETNNHNIKPVIETLLKSEHFFDQANRGCIIKPPLDYMVGFAKSGYLNMPAQTESNAVRYTHEKYINDICAVSEQALLDPPGVAGWPAYYQAPSFHEVWISSNTMPTRIALMGQMAYSGRKSQGYTLKMNLFDIAENTSDPSDPNILVNECLDYFLPMPSSENLKASTKEFLLPGGLPDFNWTTIWNTYKSDPGDATNTKTCTDLLTYMIYSILNLAEFQLH